MTFEEEVIKNTVDKLYEGKDYRDEVVNSINVSFLDFAVNFFRKIVDANRFDNLVVMHDITHRELHHNVYEPQLAWVERGLHYQTRALVVPDLEKYVDTKGILKEYQREVMEFYKQNKRGR